MNCVASVLSCVLHMMIMMTTMMISGAACKCGGRRALSSATLQSGLLLQLHAQPVVRKAQLLQRSGLIGSLCC